MLYQHTGRRGVRTNLQIQFDHHKTESSLKRCASGSACYICRVTWEKLRDHSLTGITASEAGGKESTFLTATLKLIPHRTSIFRLDLRIAAGSNTRAQTLIASFILIRKDENSEDSSNTRPCSSDTSSPEVFALAKSWIEECEKEHSSCQTSSKPFYPTRLVELCSASGECEPDGPVRLVSQKAAEQLAKQSAFEGRYVTLSHRWGKSSFIKLEKDNLARFQHAIHFSDLPLTFQHAVSFARKLGVRWIWIDALCIIQDSENDWLLESATMYEVYAHSYCNISATAAHDSSEGLFRTRDPNHDWTQTVTVRVKDIVDVNEGRFNCTVLDLSFWESSVEQAPVNVRSWVLQERLLAPRVLHWCRDQIAFECRHMDRAECRPEGVPHLLMMRGELVEGARLKKIEQDAGKDLRKLRLRREYSSPNQRRLAQMVEEIAPRWHYYEIWKRIVETYTKMELTNLEDRLIALSGVARMMKERMGSEGIRDEYIAGLWQRGLASQLLWHVNEADLHEPQPRDNNRPKTHDGSTLFRAPTFSWASVETPRGVTFAEITKVGLKISIEVVRLRYLTDDEFGILIDGYIVLRGILRRILLVDNFAEKTTAAPLATASANKPDSHGSQPARSTMAKHHDPPNGKGRSSDWTAISFWILLIYGIFATYFRNIMADTPRPSLSEDLAVPKDVEKSNRWSWSFLKEGKPEGRTYSVVYLDSPASEPTVFGMSGEVFVIPALQTSQSLICLMVQVTGGDYGIRYKRVGLTIISAVHEQEVKDILTPPTKNDIHKGRYYWGPEGRKSGESVICII